MKILLVNDYGAPHYGAELQILALRAGLRRRGHVVMLFSSRAELVPDVPIAADATCLGSTGRLQVISQVANPSAYLALRRVLRDFKPDIVHVRMFLWQLSPLILPLLRHLPSLYQVVVYKDVCPKGSKLLPDGTPCTEHYGRACLRHGCVALPTWGATMVQLALLKRWRAAFDRIIALSAPMRDVLRQSGFDGVSVVHNGVAERPMRPTLSGDPVVAYAGRLSPEKGVDLLLQAFGAIREQVPRARLVIAGDGPQADKLRRLALSLKISDRIDWLGHVPRDVMEKRFDLAWVQVVPSLWQEPFGNVTAEAMMRGTAVLASEVGGASDIVSDGSTGLLAPPGDVGALARALERTLTDRNEAERLGAAAREWALEHLSQERVVDGMLSIYHDAIASHRAPAGHRIAA